MPVINTSDCEKCFYGDVEDISKAVVKIHCRARDKTYYYGQCIQCEDKKCQEKKTED